MTAEPGRIGGAAGIRNPHLWGALGLARRGGSPVRLRAPSLSRITLCARHDPVAEPAQGAGWRRAEILPPKPCGSSRVRAGGGALVHFTLLCWCARSDSNAHWMRSGRIASAKLGYTREWCANGAGVVGTRGGIRTRTGRHLGPLPLPVGIPERDWSPMRVLPPLFRLEGPAA